MHRCGPLTSSVESVHSRLWAERNEFRNPTAVIRRMSMGILVGVGIATFCLGVLVGNSLTEMALDARSRRQAARQKRINDSWRALCELEQSLEQTTGRCLRARSSHLDLRLR